MALILNRLFRHLRAPTKRGLASQNLTNSFQREAPKISIVQSSIKNSREHCLPKFQTFSFTPSGIKLVSNVNGDPTIKKIIRCPIYPSLRIDEPPQREILNHVDIVPSTSVELPPNENVVEKRAARLIVIRRRKMKRHKLRKLRKKMKYVWAKVRQKREFRKEKEFQATLLAKIRDAENFNAMHYVEEKIKKLTEIQIPNTWRGKKLPLFIIRQKMGLDKK